jgi:hypothetical protein
MPFAQGTLGSCARRRPGVVSLHSCRGYLPVPLKLTFCGLTQFGAPVPLLPAAIIGDSS